MEDSKGILCNKLLPNVTSSAYSNSSPTEIPLAIVDTFIETTGISNTIIDRCSN